MFVRVVMNVLVPRVVPMRMAMLVPMLVHVAVHGAVGMPVFMLVGAHRSTLDAGFAVATAAGDAHGTSPSYPV
jgi:hypothetical protein